MSEKERLQSNNNNENESNENCTVCSQKTKINSSSVAIQVDAPQQNDNDLKMNGTANDGEQLYFYIISYYYKKAYNYFTDTLPDSSENALKMDNALIQNAYETINELKKEIVELRNSFETKTFETHKLTSEDISTEKPTSHSTFT